MLNVVYAFAVLAGLGVLFGGVLAVAGKVFAVDEENRVIMVRQFRYPMGEVVLELPAGKLEKG